MHTYQVLLAVWIYVTPIFYPVEIVPEQWSFIFHLNPLFHLIQIFRDPVYAGKWPDPMNLASAAAYAIGMAAIGWWYFERSRRAFASYL
jgi:ABC-type polysaccharide/polyol phosphate export permease